MRGNERLSRRLAPFLILFAIIIAVGTTGYTLLEGMTVLEAAYMTVITLSTVGFGEVHPLTPAGQVFTIVLIVSGVGTVTYLLSNLFEYIVAGELRGTWQRRRMHNQIDKLSGHFIVCGFGRVGRQVVSELRSYRANYVVVEKDPDRLANASEPLFVLGDATDDDVLHLAGIERAKGLVAATGNDADNVFITLSARALKRDLTIVARSNMPEAERKLRNAGADHVIMPHVIGGRRMASVLMHPSVVDFLDVVMHSEALELWLEDIPVSAASGLSQATMGDAQVRSRPGASVLAIKTAAGALVTDVGAASRIQPGDVLVALGTRDQLRALGQLAGETGG